jgi:hypothetical protein
MQEIYRTAFGFIHARPAFFLALAAILFAVEIYSLFAATGRLMLIVGQVFAAYGLHRALMFDESRFRAPQKPLRPMGLGGFALTSFGIGLLIVALSMLAILGLTGGAIHSLSEARLATSVIALAGLMALAVLTGFGMALPAAAAADPGAIPLAWQRGRKVWKSLGFGLVVGPGLFFLAQMALLSVLISMGLPTGPMYTAESGINLPAAMVSAVLTVLGLVITLLAVVVLCLNYRKLAPAEVRDAMTAARMMDQSPA